MEYARILQMWSVSLLLTILGQTVGILTGVVFDTHVLNGIFFVLINIYVIRKTTMKML